MIAVDAYETGVLVKEHHDRLVANIENIALDAMVQPSDLWTALTPEEVGAPLYEWVKTFPRHSREGRFGAIVYRQTPARLPDRVFTMAVSALVRNFIRARLTTTSEIIAAAEDDDMRDYSALFVPDFAPDLTKESQTLPAWKLSLVHELLLTRRTLGLQTVLFAENLASLKSRCGSAVAEFVIGNYTSLKI